MPFFALAAILFWLIAVGAEAMGRSKKSPSVSRLPWFSGFPTRMDLTKRCPFFNTRFGRLAWTVAAMATVLSLSGLGPAKGNESGLSAWATAPQVLPHRTMETTVGLYHQTIGEELLEKGQVLAAKPHLEQAVTVFPTDKTSWFMYALALDLLEQDQEARQAYETLLNLDPDNTQTRFRLAQLLARKGDVQPALAHLQAVQHQQPDNPLVYYELGVLHAMAHQFPQSIQASEKAIALGLATSEAYNNLGYALAQQGQKLPEALKAVNQALTMAEPTAAVLDSKGYVYFRMGDHHEALRWYNKALELDPTVSEIYLHQAQALEALGQLDSALRAYQLYVRLHPDSLESAEARNRIEYLRQIQQPAKAEKMPSRLPVDTVPGLLPAAS